MKHFSKKKLFQGAGWFSKPQQPYIPPSILRPPDLAGYKILQSYSVTEIIDLISDGPIHGLVNKNGELLNNKNILQGIYLDNTPVQGTPEPSEEISVKELGFVNIASTLNILGDVYYQKETPEADPFFKPITVRYYHGEYIKFDEDSYGQYNTPVSETSPYVPGSEPRVIISDYFIINKSHILFVGLVCPIREQYGYGWQDLTLDIFGDSSLEKQYDTNPALIGKYISPILSSYYYKNYPGLYKKAERLNSPFKTDWTAITRPSYKTWYYDSQQEGLRELILTKKNTINGHSIEVNVTNAPLGSEGLLASLKTKLNNNLASSTQNQKHFINLALNSINELSKRNKASPMDPPYGKYMGKDLFMRIPEATLPGYIIIDMPSINIAKASGESIFKLNGENIIDDFYFFLDIYAGYQDLITPIIVPKINANNEFTGEFYGCLVIQINISKKYARLSGTLSCEFDDSIALFANSVSKLFFYRGKKIKDEIKTVKYNFSNIACEFKNGEEIQNPLSDFKYIYVDYDYDSDLIGPFNKSSNSFMERVLAVDLKRGDGQIISSYSAAKPNLIGNVNSSVDKRGERNFGSFNDVSMFNEEPVPFTHTIENANVEFVAFTLFIRNLYDIIDVDEPASDGRYYSFMRKIGDKRPAILRIAVEIGTNIDGKIDVTYKKEYAVIALVEGQMLIDFGDPSLKGRADNYIAVRDFTDGTNKASELSEIFPLPSIDKDKNSTDVKRFIKVTKLSAETNSVLIKKEAGIYKVTEIIPNKLSYPFSAIAGMKIDARSFSNLPERTYDCRLKLVQIPSNYFPLNENKKYIDKRYIKDKSSYNRDQLIYQGDWDGTFKPGWTDNPAWIIYDLLTSKRYGIGSHLKDIEINKWELYKIGRFCDAVDDDGYFIGVSDGIGGLEPRYSCNIVFKDPAKIYDSIISITNLFRGMCYFYNSEVHFVDDRPRLPIITFTNNNVKDGVFNYSNTRRDQQYNTVEVSYLDRFDNFQSKVEYVEDEQDIRKRGFRKTIIETFGVTSRAMARRMGQHLIYQTIKENQAVEFTAGLEALLCRPGDLMIIEDDLKTRSTNQGKILSTNTANKSLLLNNTYLPDEFNGKITVYVPTGHQTSNDIEGLAFLNRSRLPYFDITGDLINSNDNILTGRYYFSEYKNNDNWLNYSTLFQQYPLYTGLSNMGHKIFCYYSNVASGFVFSTGLAYQDNNIYDKVITDTGLNQISEIFTNEGGINRLNSGYRYEKNNINRRSTSANISNKIKIFTKEYVGILESEIDTNSNAQTINYNITGYDVLDYGSRVFLDQNNININLLDFVPADSSYRIGRNNAEDQIYKVLAIKEENQNEYVVVGSKFNTGKFVEIENFSKEDFLSDTYYSGPSKVGNIDIKELKAPEITNFTTGVSEIDSFSLKANWLHNLDALKYRYNVYNEIFNVRYTGETTQNLININKVNYLGDWKIDLYSVGNGGSKIDSQPSKSGIFVAYYEKGFNKLTKAAITDFIIT
jgi:hypothetical protein